MTDTTTPEPAQHMELYWSLFPPSHHELLRRCALLDSFDGDITADLSPDGDATLDDLLEYPFVYQVRGQPGAYRLREDIRHSLMESWWEGQPPDAVPPELSGLCEHLATRLERISRTDRATVVGLRLFVDDQAALRDALSEWKKLYAAADQRFDLLRCRSLIGVLTWMATVSPDVEEVREEYQAYADARSLWTDEWYRSSSILHSEVTDAAFDSLLTGDRGRMLELRGAGGYGKTTHLRWLIARRCVPADLRAAGPGTSMPCAHIDFDAVDPVVATRDPYLVVLEMADQLDRQLPGDAFGTLVRGHTARRAQLYRRDPAGAARNSEEPSTEQGRASSAADVLQRFGARVAEMPDDRPVVLVLDTLEVPLHLPGTAGVPAIKPLLVALAETQRKAPGVRIILAGRYHLSDDLRELFADRCNPFELPKFTPQEARSYLVDKRGVRGSKHVRAAVQASDCVPFSLALLADLIEQDPEISADTITSYRGAEYAYLVERVVKRIKEKPVRWVLRYAAIPRRFDYEFVRDVLWRRVREVMSGDVSLDDPASDDLPGSGKGQDPPWQAGDQAPAEDEAVVRQVWDQVRRYAGGSSWVRTDEEDRDALRLQTEVVRPLRALLRGKDIVPTLHADAAEYFLRRAGEELPRAAVGTRALSHRDRRGDFLREAVFHRFQLEGQAAGRWWEEQIHGVDDPRDRYALADEIARGTDYTDQARQPTRWGDTDLVDGRTLQRAWLEVCLASAELASAGRDSLEVLRLPGETPGEGELLWQTAADALSRVEATSTASLPPGRLAVARAAVTLGTSAANPDLDKVRRALEEPGPTPRERLWIAVLDAQRLVTAVSPDAAKRLADAKQLAEQAPQERDLRRRLAIASVQHHNAWGAYDRAMEDCVRAVRDQVGDTQFRLAEAMLRIKCGDAEGARSAAAAIEAADPAMAGVATLLEAVSLSRQYRFALANGNATRALAIAEAPNGPPLKSWVRGHALEVIGECAAALLLVDDARAAFAEALRVFEDADDPEAVSTCHLDEARLLIREVGQLRAGGVALDSASRAAPDGETAALRALLLRAELNARLEDPEGAAEALRRARSANRGAATPPRMALIAAAGLDFSEPWARDRFSAQLADSLGQLSPPAARLQLLGSIEWEPVLGLQPTAAKRLRDQVIPPDGWDEELGHLAPLDRAALRLGAAAFSIVLGDHADAERMLCAALTEFRDGNESPAELRKILHLGWLLRSQRVVAEAGPVAVQNAMAHAEDFPLLAAATAIEYVEAAQATGTEYWMDPEELCARAEELLTKVGSSAEGWSARLAELRATVGQPSDRIKTAHLETAARIYAAVGDRRKAEQVRNLVPGLDVGSDLGKSRVDVEVTFSRDTVKAKVRGWHLLPSRRRSSPLRAAVEEWVRSAGHSPYPPELPDLMLGDWRGFTAAMGDLISASEVRRRQGRILSRAELSMRIHDGALQSLPWELASDSAGLMITERFRRVYRAPARDVPNTRLVRVVQAGLNRLGYLIPVDGVSGPDTDQALAKWQRDSAAPQDKAYRPETVQRLHVALLHGATPQVLIVRAAASEGRRRSFALERRYARAGMEPCRVDDSHATGLHAALNGEPPPVVVHIVGGLVATSGAVGIDLLEGGAWGPSRPGRAELFTATDLDRALRAVPPNWPSPVVVLEVPLPTGRREAADQLLLRNSFAAGLFAMGGTQEIIGSGLAPAKDIRLVQDVLVEGLARGDAIGDIVQAMRRQRRGQSGRFESGIAFAATALWTTSPGMRLPILRAT